MHTLIPNPNPNLRILLHRAEDSGETFLTVEELEHDAIGTPQWRMVDDGRHEKIRAAAILAAITYAHPRTLTSDTPVALGTCRIGELTYRCSVSVLDRSPMASLDGTVVLTTETLDHDQTGAPRWKPHDRLLLTCSDGKPRVAWIDPDFVVGCLFGLGA